MITGRIVGIIASGALGLLLIGCSPRSLEAGSDPAGNLLQNPGFENVDGNQPAGWTPEPRAAGKGEIRLVGSPVHSGARSLKLIPNLNNNQPGISGAPLAMGQGFPGESYRGKTLHIAGWLGAEGDASAVCGIYVLKKNGSVELVELSEHASGGKLAYHRDVLNVSTDRGIRFLVVNCHVDGTSGAGYFDDLYVGTAVPSEGPVTKSAPVPGLILAQVTLDPTRDIRPIPPALYGTNVEWIRNANGLYNPATNGLDRRLTGLARDLGVSLIRFPGGIFCDFYHWKNGVGPRASRPRSPHMPGSNETSPNNFGTDEALELARDLGAPLLITVNIVTGTPQEAVEWLQYIASRTGPGKAPPVTYWEIGNEQYVKGDEEYAKAGTMAPDEYARRFLKFAAALKSADPSAKVGLISDENYGRTIPHPYPNWTEQVLAQAASQADFVAVHNAYAPMVIDARGLSVRDVYTGLLAAPELVSQSLDRLSAMISRYDPQGRIKIAVTEWGPMFHLLPSSPYVDHVKTLGSALYAASVMRSFLLAPRVEAADFFKLSDLLFMGWIGKRQGAWIPNAPYYAFQLYTRHFGKVVVESTTQVPGFRSRTVGWVDAVANAPYLAVIASRSPDSKAAYLIAINRSLDQDVKMSVQVRHATPAPEGTAWILTGTGIDANTGTELPSAGSWARQASDDRNPRFYQGKPEEITFRSERVTGISRQFEYVVPKHSAVSLEFGIE